MQSAMAPRTESARSKRAAITAAAINRFGSDGYEHTKWSTIADDVGIGETALYHYFESKAHCLLTIMRTELADSLDRFQRVNGAESEPGPALRRSVISAYAGGPRDALQRRILQNHVDLLSAPRSSAKEEHERLRSRALVREIEEAWTDLIARGMRTGGFAQRDPLMSARMVLALVVGVWRWYRPGGPHTLDQIGALNAEAALRILA